MEPKSHESPKVDETALWIVWRIDDNGNTFVVQDGLTKQAADRLVEEFTARGHKQTYWAERSARN
jgi:UDP-N-acetyl-2-amino-2-deoxyglucuronate dehydrogenase